MHSLPVRWRLTLWYTLLIALVMLILGGVVFGSLRWRLLDALDDSLRDYANVLSPYVAVEGGVITSAAVADIRDPYGVEVYAFESGPVPIERGGNGLIPVPGAESLPAPAEREEGTPGPLEIVGIDSVEPGIAGVDRALEGDAGYVDTVSAGGSDLRSILMPITDPETETIVGALQVSRSREEVDKAIRELGRTLAVMVPVMLVLAAGVGYLLAGWALRPVSRITTLAAAISAHDLHERLNLDLPNDELGRLAQTFDSMLERMQHGFELQAQFTGNAAHELRTPLTMMRGQIDLAKGRARTVADYQEAIDQLDIDVVRMTSLTETLLALARADNGQLVIDASPFDIADTIDAVVDLYRSTTEGTGIDVDSRCEPLMVIGDEHLIIQVLVNLVDNAIAFTPAGGTITISGERDRDEAIVRVIDTGSGIAPEHHERVFDRFYRATSSHRDGAGLGLAICKVIVENHGGTIRLDSVAGEGTTVEMRLPIHDAISPSSSKDTT